MQYETWNPGEHYTHKYVTYCALQQENIDGFTQSVLTDTESFTHDYSSSEQYRSIWKLLFQEGSCIEMKAPKHKIGLIDTGLTERSKTK